MDTFYNILQSFIDTSRDIEDVDTREERMETNKDEAITNVLEADKIFGKIHFSYQLQWQIFM